MKVLLVPPKNNYPDPRPSLDVFGQGFPYIAGALKKGGHEVFGLNINHKWCHGSAPLMLEVSLRKAIAEYQPQLIGLGGLSADYSFIRDAMLFIRDISPDVPIVCGGGIVTYDREYIFTKLRPDFALSGEAEDTMVALADFLETGGDVRDIPNCAFWRDDSPVYNRLKYHNENIDTLSWPDYNPFDYEIFLDSLNQNNNILFGHTRHRPRIMPVTFGRSCPFECTFCCHEIGRWYRERSIDSGIEEIIYFYEKYDFNILFIYDELFATRRQRINDFCERIKVVKEELNMDFDWTCDLRVSGVKQDTLKQMKDAGCIFIGYGLESASPSVLKSMQKKITVDQIVKAINITQEAGLGVQGNFIFGDIAETEETIHETKEFFDTWCKNLMVHFNYLTPYPGSKIFQYCIDNSIIRDKELYYKQIGPIGKYRVNMTRMPDKEFFDLVDGMVSITDVSVQGMFGLKKGDLLSCIRIERFTPDLSASFPLRRSLYMIECICPHCTELVNYLYPFRVGMSDQGEALVIYCSNCHNRFTMDISEHVNEYSEQNSVEAYYSFKKSSSFVDQVIPSYKGYNIIDFVSGTDVYGIPQSLGKIDVSDRKQLSHPDILVAGGRAEVKELIKRKVAEQEERHKVQKVERIEETEGFNVLREEVSERDERIAELHRDLWERKKPYTQLTEELKEKDKVMETFQKNVAEKDEQIKDLNASIEELNDLIKTLQEELVDIKSSRWFRLFYKKGKNARG